MISILSITKTEAAAVRSCSGLGFIPRKTNGYFYNDNLHMRYMGRKEL